MRKQCLIVRGGWSGHDPVAATEVFIPALEEPASRSTLKTRLRSTRTRSPWRAYDLIVQCFTLGSATVDEVAGLRAAVAAGAGSPVGTAGSSTPSGRRRIICNSSAPSSPRTRTRPRTAAARRRGISRLHRAYLARGRGAPDPARDGGLRDLHRAVLGPHGWPQRSARDVRAGSRRWRRVAEAGDDARGVDPAMGCWAHLRDALGHTVDVLRNPRGRAASSSADWCGPRASWLRVAR